MSGSLTAKQIRFIEEYLVDLNATQAATRAGYSAKTAYSAGQRLLKHVEVAEAISAARKAQAERTEVSADAVIAELAKLGFANMADYMKAGPNGDPYLDFSKLTRDQAAALIEVTVDDYIDGRGEDSRAVRRVKFKLADKRAALVELGRHFGIFQPDRAEITFRNVEPEDLTDDEIDRRLAAIGARRAAIRARRGGREASGNEASTPTGSAEPSRLVH
jgi:phage terminase small subunit